MKLDPRTIRVGKHVRHSKSSVKVGAFKRRHPETEYVTKRTWDNMARRLERERLDAFGSSLTAGSIARYANSYIIETFGDGTPLFVRKGWREAMIAAAQADDFKRGKARSKVTTLESRLVKGAK